ncbi:Hypothetical protein GLP15_3086 [Giardia lamblia P15]|uniref:Uncharacterized protein n=1 Tax=Giardia intestinalis (strain P15) TaxID=658858 RepID=E1F2U5_GIAIA|nr:Hypothetical protein GLP15_3086 [Giardia lamblia P15]
MGWDLPIDGLPSPATSPGRRYLESDYRMNNSSLCEPECEAPEPHAEYRTHIDSKQVPIGTPMEFRYVNVTNPRQTSIETGTFTINTPSIPCITESIIDDQELEGPAVWQKKQHIGIHSDCSSGDDLSLKKPSQPKMVKPSYTYQALSSNLPKIPTDEELNTLIAVETHKTNFPKKHPVSNLAKTVEKKAQLAPKSGVGRDVIMRKLGAILTDTPGDVPIYAIDDKTLVALTEQTLMGFNDSLYKW